MEHIADIICQISNILFNNIMKKITNIYVIITGYYIKEINIHQCRKSIHYYMLDLPVFNNISIYKYHRVILVKFILADGVYITCTFNQVKVKVIANIKS